jgi:hypothetical protein
MDLSAVLVRRWPGKEFVLDGETIEGLTWLDDSPAPTLAEIESFWPDVLAEIEAEAQDQFEAKKSAIAKLRKLGLTDAEINSIVGIY